MNKQIQKSIKKTLLKIFTIIFVVEIFIMLSFHYLHIDVNPYLEAIFDGVLLSGLSFIPIYFFIILPYVKKEHKAIKTLENYKNAIDQHSILTTTDVEGTILDVNSKFSELSEYSEQELIGNNHRILNSGNKPKEYWKNMYDTVSKGITWNDKVLNRSKSGRLYWVNTTIYPVMDNGKPISYIAIRTDITHEVELQTEIEDYSKNLEATVEERTKELLEAKKVAEEANEQKSRFLSNMSHELRTPIHAITSFAGLGVKKTKDNKSLNDYFEKIIISSKRLEDMVESFLDINDASDYQLSPYLQKESLATKSNDIIRVHDTIIRNKDLKFNIIDETNQLIELDTRTITKVIKHLIKNAIVHAKYSSDIVINITENSKSQRFSITNIGNNIPEDELQQIFQPFKEGSHTQSDAGGRGLGLAICLSVIKSHNGTIWAENLESGVKFSFEIPIEQPKQS